MQDYDSIDSQIGLNIRRFRTLRGVTQQQIARGINVSSQQMQKYEKGASPIPVGRLYRIAEFMGVEPEHFFDDLASRSTPNKEDNLESTNVVRLGENGVSKDVYLKRETIEFVRLFGALNESEKDAVRQFLQKLAKPKPKVKP